MPPNLFLIAAPRSGSTQLAAWLSSHDAISLPPIKEPNFYAQHEFPPDYVAAHRLNDVDPEKYVAKRSHKVMQFAIFRTEYQYDYLFQGLNSQYRMDASTTYLHCPEASQAIHARHAGAKIILLTRDPVSRALSHYRLAVRTGRTALSLREELEAEFKGDTPLPGRFLLRQSRYIEAVQQYRDTFDQSQIIEIKFEEMVNDPDLTLKQIGKFLGIKPDGFDTKVKSQNAGDMPRFKLLNIFLLNSGIKTWLRNILPISMKRKLKLIYFRPNIEQPDPRDISLLKKYLDT